MAPTVVGTAAVPAHAGVSPDPLGSVSAQLGRPRPRGGEPLGNLSGNLAGVPSPPTRG